MTTRAARALIRLVDRPQQGYVCPGCRVDGTPIQRPDAENQVPLRWVDFQMTLPPVDEGFELTGKTEPLAMCETCLRDAARVLGLHRDPGEHPDIKRLTAARDAASAKANEALVEQRDALERLRQAEVV